MRTRSRGSHRSNNHLHAGHSAATRTDYHAHRLRGPHGQNFQRPWLQDNRHAWPTRPSASNPPEASCFNAPGSSCRPESPHDAGRSHHKIVRNASSSSSQCQTIPDPVTGGETRLERSTQRGAFALRQTPNHQLPDPISEAQLVEPDGIEPTTS
jgi:hypothetical protein